MFKIYGDYLLYGMRDFLFQNNFLKKQNWCHIIVYIMTGGNNILSLQIYVDEPIFNSTSEDLLPSFAKN